MLQILLITCLYFKTLKNNLRVNIIPLIFKNWARINRPNSNDKGVCSLKS